MTKPWAMRTASRCKWRRSASSTALLLPLLLMLLLQLLVLAAGQMLKTHCVSLTSSSELGGSRWPLTKTSCSHPVAHSRQQIHCNLHKLTWRVLMRKAPSLKLCQILHTHAPMLTRHPCLLYRAVTLWLKSSAKMLCLLCINLIRVAQQHQRYSASFTLTESHCIDQYCKVMNCSWAQHLDSLSLNKH